MSPDAARKLLALRFDARFQARIDLLANKCNAGQLSDDERTEYETFVRIIDFLAIIQVKARAFLKDLSGN